MRRSGAPGGGSQSEEEALQSVANCTTNQYRTSFGHNSELAADCE
ncbi:hypothetical protein E2C01_036270 [Portunus trituberculatus]|uniref:Uncharacterized protein n=1 Tax=Portunus trituberculatus TaxID=210409 RepID=A0A5B7FBZ9_PORTR|nr:hypothetical protein [Portunus trituberculatus]